MRNWHRSGIPAGAPGPPHKMIETGIIYMVQE